MIPKVIKFVFLRFGTAKKTFGKRMSSCESNVSIRKSIVAIGSTSGLTEDRPNTTILEQWAPTVFGPLKMADPFTSTARKNFICITTIGEIYK
jgi:hypothetical protein